MHVVSRAPLHLLTFICDVFPQGYYDQGLLLPSDFLSYVLYVLIYEPI